jgi:hypothetical protein
MGRDWVDESNEYLYLIAKREEIEVWIKLKSRLVITGETHAARVFFDLSQQKLRSFSLGEDGILRALTSEQDILAAINHTAQKLPGVTRVRTYQMTTEEKLVKEANLIVRDGNPIAYVAVDRPLETWAKRKISSNDEFSIESAIRALSHFPSDSNADWLRKEIADRKPSADLTALKGLLTDWGASDE